MAFGARSNFIDTLRGLSITLVLLHHFNIAYSLRDTELSALFGWNAIHALVRNGNYAVTMFFTISGFLITSNADHRWNGLANIHALSFYRNRAARIFPCLLILLAIVNVLAAQHVAIFGNQADPDQPLSRPMPMWVVDLASLTFWMNVLMTHAGWINYVLCVQWSLSVEEVFYLTFPILCLVLRRERLLLAAWTLFIIVGPIWRATHQTSEYAELNANLACFDGIAFGCIAAIVARRVHQPARAATALAIATASAMAWLYLCASIAVTAVYGVTLIAFGTAILLLAHTQKPAPPIRPPPPRALALLRRCGRLSYELYLFHLVVLGGLRTLCPPSRTTADETLILLAVYLMASFILAACIGRAVSDPLNRLLRAPRTV